MKIGLTYDLRNDYLAEGYSEEETAEFDQPDTIEAIEAALLELGYQTDRIGNAKRLVERLAQGDRWDLVFNIAEGLHGAGPRGPGAGDPRRLRHPLHVFRPAGALAGPAQGADEDASCGRRASPRPISPWSSGRPTSTPSTCPFRCSPSRWPKAPAKASRRPRKSSTARPCGRSAPTCWSSSASRCWSRRSSPAASSPSA